MLVKMRLPALKGRAVFGLYVKNILIVVLITFLALFISAEVYLKYFSFLARPLFSGKFIKTPVCRRDPQLGWRNKPGVYTALSSSSEDMPITVTINNDGSRATAARDTAPDDHRDKIILAGGSVMFGEGLSNEQTMGWKLARMLPEMSILNCGVNGYGTYQSLLLLEEVLPKIPNKAFVIYGFIAHHIDRNIAPAYWRALFNVRPGQNVSVPHVTLNHDRTLLRHNPEQFSFSVRPVSDYLVTFRFIEAILNRKKFLDGNNTEKHTVMQLLLLEMRDMCQAHGCQLIVAMLTPRQDINDMYTGFCRLNRIPVINFDLDSIRDKPPLIPGEGHPNETVNTLWAEQTADFFSGLWADGKNQKKEVRAP